ncbi:MAG: dihydroorotate dehydrogenase B catalytic subunit [Planctomycetes bacterium]|jgi:dihydroorotate dehydrogenase (NAD+) catalytic subunit|nr:dihydroorotate dehydrogenase B catalytic subunit [Planctomycetota bacterium]MDP6409073.1 dihydroorotate dehydrogenase [Planctomycetota bacterium]
MADLSVELASLALRNPILSASGTFGHGLEMERFSSPQKMGGLVSKTVTLRPRPGNAAPRIHETEAGLLNSIGLENRGIEAYLRDVLPEVAGADTRIFTNIGGEAAEEFAELAAMLDERTEVDALEINLSCPNVGGGRLPFSTEPALAEAVVRGVRAATRKPIFAKLSPNVTRIGEIARGAEAGGADGVTAVNTLLGMAVDWRTGRPRVANVQAGYSGKGIKPVALRCAWECARAVDIPVIGCGGVSSAEDVLEFVVVGCSAVQVGTAAFSDPALPGNLAVRVEALLDAEGVASVRELVGTLETERKVPS